MLIIPSFLLRQPAKYFADRPIRVYRDEYKQFTKYIIFFKANDSLAKQYFQSHGNEKEI